jgi:hypothetical protein
MKRSLLAAAVAFACAGCSDADKTAAAMSAFIKACKAPVSAKMSLGSIYGNSIEMSCTELAPNTEAVVKH